VAKTIAHAVGYDATRVKRTHRLGHDHAEAGAATWRTFADVCVWPDGSGHFTLKRDDKVICSYQWEAEDAR